MNGVKRRRVDVEYGKGGRGRSGELTRMREEKGERLRGRERVDGRARAGTTSRLSSDR